MKAGTTKHRNKETESIGCRRQNLPALMLFQCRCQVPTHQGVSEVVLNKCLQVPSCDQWEVRFILSSNPPFNIRIVIAFPSDKTLMEPDQLREMPVGFADVFSEQALSSSSFHMALRSPPRPFLPCSVKAEHPAPLTFLWPWAASLLMAFLLDRLSRIRGVGMRLGIEKEVPFRLFLFLLLDLRSIRLLQGCDPQVATSDAPPRANPPRSHVGEELIEHLGEDSIFLDPQPVLFTKCHILSVDPILRDCAALLFLQDR